MSFLALLVLGLVQGLTEFLPVSSSGHLNLLQYFFHFHPSLYLDVILNTATLLAVLFFFRKKASFFFSHLKFILIGTLPAAAIGFFLTPYSESIFSQIRLLPFFFLITSFFVFSLKFLPRQDKQLTLIKAFIIGLFQALALFPGISRSAVTLFAGSLLGLSPLTAFNFSFALFIPVSLGALLLNLPQINQIALSLDNLVLVLTLTFFVGLLALKLTQQLVKKHHLWLFSLYTFTLSLVLFLFIL